MSRIGRLPVAIPASVAVSIKSQSIEVKGPKGTLAAQVPQGISASQDGSSVTFARSSDERAVRALHGLARALLANMIKGVTEGFSKSLEVIGVGYSAKVQGRDLLVSVGFSQPVKMTIPEGLDVPAPTTANISMTGVGSVPVTTLTIRGADKQKVGQFAASIRAIRPPEPYKGKGIRYKGEEVRKKAGKAMAGAE